MRYLILLIASLLFQQCGPKGINERLLLQSNGDKLSYSVSGKGSTIIFLHAGGLEKSMWKYQQLFFQKKAKTIAHDIRGHGKSEGRSIDSFEVDDLNNLLNEEQLHEKVTLVGCSLGAIVAIDYILAFPERVEKMVLVSPGLIGFQESDTTFLAQVNDFVQAIQSGDQKSMVKTLMVMNALGNNEQALAANIHQYVEASLIQYIDRGAYLNVPRFKVLNPLDSLGRVHQETLILYGTSDHTYIQQNAVTLDEILPNSTLTPIKEAAHLINLEQAKTFNAVLYEFLFGVD